MAQPVVPVARDKSSAAAQRADAVLVVRGRPSGSAVPAIFAAKGKGAVLTDLDGNSYLDYAASGGALILGHADAQVAAAITKMLTRGWSFSARTEQEIQLAERITRAMPAVDRVSFTAPGPEALRAAMWAARAATGRGLVVVAGGAGWMARNFGREGVDALLVAFNDLAAIDRAASERPGDLAAVLLEPVATAGGVVGPVDGYLRGVREYCTRRGAMLVFDETVTGFRVAYGGAQECHKVRPDITCLGGVIGGGLPLGAVGLSEDVVGRIESSGSVIGRGSWTASPLALAAGSATLDALIEQGVYERLETLSSRLVEGIADAAGKAGMPVSVSRVGSVISISAPAASPFHTEWFRLMLDQGIYMPPEPLDPLFVSLAHTEKHIDRTIEASSSAFRAIAANRE